MPGQLHVAAKHNDASRAATMRRQWSRDHSECVMGEDGSRWQRRAATFDTRQDRWWLAWRQLRLDHD